ncbi:MAG: FecR domain-containing protein, partial [Spirochaetota bacterium]
MNTSRRWPVTALITVLLSVLIVALATAATLPASRRATVALTRGDVRIDGIKADIGQELGASAIVETGQGARCDISFGGGNALSVSQNARVRLDFASPAIGVRLDRDGVTSVVKKLDKLVDRAAFNVSTQLSTAGVRGTSFCVWCDAD